MRISESRLKCNVQPFWFNDLLGWLLAKPVTLKMIAERLGVSVQTVSNVLQSTGRVAAATAERVQKVASEMGYVPNAGAQALRGKSTKTLSFILSDPVLTTTPSAYLGFLIPVVASAIREAGFTPSIQFADDTDIDAALLPARQGLVDGVLLLANRLDAGQIEAISRLPIPIALFEREAPVGTLPYVTTNATEGVASAVRHLHAQGARRIAYLDGRPHWPMTTSVRRFEGFNQAIEELGLPKLPAIEGNWQFESGVAAFETMLARGGMPEAVVCANDQMAVGFLKAAQRHGIKVPADLLVTGFDDLEFARYTTPQLTSVRLPLADMSRGAAALLTSMISGGGVPGGHQSSYPAELIIRESSTRHFYHDNEHWRRVANA